MDRGTERYDQTDGYEAGIVGNVLSSALSSGTGLFCVHRENLTRIRVTARRAARRDRKRQGQDGEERTFSTPTGDFTKNPVVSTSDVSTLIFDSVLAHSSRNVDFFAGQ
jgi:hypothetical protein